MVAETQITDDVREMYLDQIDESIEECGLQMGIDDKNVLKLAGIEKILYKALIDLKEYKKKYGDKDKKAEKLFRKAMLDHKIVCSDIIKAWDSTDSSEDKALANYIIKLSKYFYERDKPYSLAKTLFEGLCKLKDSTQKEIVEKILQEKVDLVCCIAAIFNIQKDSNFEDLLVAERLFYPLIPTSDKKDISDVDRTDISLAHYRACQFIIQDWDDETSVPESDFTNYIVKLLSYLTAIEDPKNLAKLIQLGMNKLKDPKEIKWIENEILSSPELTYLMTLAFDGLKNLSSQEFVSIEGALNRSIQALEDNLKGKQNAEKNKVSSYIEKVKSLHSETLFTLCNFEIHYDKISEEGKINYALKLVSYLNNIIPLIEPNLDYRGVASAICNIYKTIKDEEAQKKIENQIRILEKDSFISVPLSALEKSAEISLKRNDPAEVKKFIDSFKEHANILKYENSNNPYIFLYVTYNVYYNGRLKLLQEHYQEAASLFTEVKDFITQDIKENHPLYGNYKYIYLNALANLQHTLTFQLKESFNSGIVDPKALADIKSLTRSFIQNIAHPSIKEYDRNKLFIAQEMVARSIQNICLDLYQRANIQDNLPDAKKYYNESLEFAELLKKLIDNCKKTPFQKISDWKLLKDNSISNVKICKIEQVEEHHYVFIDKIKENRKRKEASLKLEFELLYSAQSKKSSGNKKANKNDTLKQFNVLLNEINGKLSKVKKGLTAAELSDFKTLADRISKAKTIQVLPENIEQDFVKALEATIKVIEQNRNLKNKNSILGDLGELLAEYKPEINAGVQEEKPNLPAPQVQQPIDKKESIATKAVKVNGFVEVGPSKKTHDKPKPQLKPQNKPAAVTQSKTVPQAAIKPTPKATDVDLSKYNWAKPKVNNEKVTEAAAKSSVNPVTETKKDIAKEAPIKTPIILTVTELEKKWVKSTTKPDLDEITEALKSDLNLDKTDPIKKIIAEKTGEKEAITTYEEVEKMLKAYKQPEGDNTRLSNLRTQFSHAIKKASDYGLKNIITKSFIGCTATYLLEAQESETSKHYHDSIVGLSRGFTQLTLSVGHYLKFYKKKVQLNKDFDSETKAITASLDECFKNYMDIANKLIQKDDQNKSVQTKILPALIGLQKGYEEKKKQIRQDKGFSELYEYIDKETQKPTGRSM
jgi:hypothetical protein